MTQLSDFPPDVQAAARRAYDAYRYGGDYGIIEAIALAISDDRKDRLNVGGLTSRQAECLRFIAAHQRENDGITPSYQEIKDGLGLASKSGVTRLLDELEDRGRIRRLAGMARAITIISTPAS